MFNMKMSELIKWIFVGVLIFIGFYLSSLALNLVRSYSVEEEEYIEANEDQINEIEISEHRLVNNSLMYSVYFKINNRGNKDKYTVLVKAVIEDKIGAIDVCQDSYIRVKSGETIEDSLSCRGVSLKVHPSAKLQKIFVSSAYVEK